MKSTKQLGIYMLKLYENLLQIASRDNVYRPLSVYFATNPPLGHTGSFCYQKLGMYYYGAIGDKGECEIIIATKDLKELVYRVFINDILLMASNYAAEHAEDGNFHEIFHKKRVKYFQAIGEEYAIMAAEQP